MKHGTIITNAYITLPGIEYVEKRMKEELESLGIEVNLETNASILSRIESDGSLSSDLKTDFVLYLDKDPYIAILLEKQGIRLFNKAEAIRLCDDKMLTYIALSSKGIKMPKTITAPLNYSGNSKGNFTNNLMKELDFPFIAKTNFGSQGGGVFLIKDKEDLLTFEEAHLSSPRLYQSDIISSFGMDYRLIVIGGKFLTGMRRRNESGDFRSNIAIGGIGEKVEIPANFIQIAEKAASILDLDYCGVDLLQGPNGEPVLCEVNSNAFMEGIEKASGTNVAEAYANYIKSVIA